MATKCKHDGDIFPLNAEKSLRRDVLLGWVVDVECDQCKLTGIAAVNCKVIDWDEEEPMTNERLVKLYGPFHRINRDRETELTKTGKWQHILTIIGCDVPYDELPEDDRPSDEELKDRGDTRENFMGYMQEATVGHHRVNVDEIFESTKPMPEDFKILDFWFDDFLKAP